MVDYYSALKMAAYRANLQSGAARRSFYDDARNILLRRLDAIAPPLNQSEISQEKLKLEEAIQRVERELDSPQEQAEQRFGAAAGRAPGNHDDWQSREVGSGVRSDPHVDRLNHARPSGRWLQQEEDFEEADAPVSEGPARRPRLPTILLYVLIVVVIAGIGALSWKISNLLASSDNVPTEIAAPEAVPAPPDVESKSEGTLSDGSAGSSVRGFGDSGLPAPPARSDAVADTNGSTRELKAALYEQPLDAAAVIAPVGATVEWQFIQDGRSGPEISADLEVPARAMTVGLVIRHNNDPTLPASHVIEVAIDTPSDFPAKGIRGVPGIVFKESVKERGQPLIGAATKVADGLFWIALSADEAGEAERNLLLLKEGSFIDLRLLYENNQGAILSFEKGPQGREVFERAFAAWGPTNPGQNDAGAATSAGGLGNSGAITPVPLPLPTPRPRPNP